MKPTTPDTVRVKSYAEIQAQEKRDHFHYGIIMIVAGCVLLVAQPSPIVGWLGGASLVLGFISQRWFWIAAFAIATVTCAVTALACIIHFMIFPAVAAVFGALFSGFLFRLAIAWSGDH